MSDNPLNKHVPGHCPAWPTKDRLTESTRTEREEDLDAFGGWGFSRCSPLGCWFHPQGGAQNLWMVSCKPRNRLVYALRAA